MKKYFILVPLVLNLHGFTQTKTNFGDHDSSTHSVGQFHRRGRRIFKKSVFSVSCAADDGRDGGRRFIECPFKNSGSFVAGLKMAVMYSPPTSATAASEAALDTNMIQLIPKAMEG